MQASRSWNKRFDKEIKRFGFTQNLVMHVYIKRLVGVMLHSYLYVDGHNHHGKSLTKFTKCKRLSWKVFFYEGFRGSKLYLGIKIYRYRSKRLIGLGQNAYMDKILKGLQVKQKKDEIFISLEKYVTEILKKFGFTDVKTTSTPMETQKLLLKDEDDEEVDVHLYRSMIGSLMYLTSLRPDIMFVVYLPCDLVAYTDSMLEQAWIGSLQHKGFNSLEVD
ncbi:hypothetical protein Tco_0188960 [Tanacetum coccineum]